MHECSFYRRYLALLSSLFFLFLRYITHFGGHQLLGWPSPQLTALPILNYYIDTKERIRPNASVTAALIQEARITKPRQRASDFLPSHKANPLLAFLKAGNTLNGQVFSFRPNGGKQQEKDTVTLVLKPVARAIAGQDGKAIATPVSRAVLQEGVNADILFEPEAVAVAGPGGIAHAESDLEISYEDVMK